MDDALALQGDITTLIDKPVDWGDLVLALAPVLMLLGPLGGGPALARLLIGRVLTRRAGPICGGSPAIIAPAGGGRHRAGRAIAVDVACQSRRPCQHGCGVSSGGIARWPISTRGRSVLC